MTLNLSNDQEASKLSLLLVGSYQVLNSVNKIDYSMDTLHLDLVQISNSILHHNKLCCHRFVGIHIDYCYIQIEYIYHSCMDNLTYSYLYFFMYTFFLY